MAARFSGSMLDRTAAIMVEREVYASLFSNDFSMTITLSVGSQRQYCRLVGWNDNFCIGLMSQSSLRNRFAIVGTITNEGIVRVGDLCKKICNGGGVTYLWCGELTGKNMVRPVR